jgi:PLP dependent protein
MSSASILKAPLSRASKNELIATKLTSLLSQIRLASHSEAKIPRLVVVTRGRSVTDIRAAYDVGQRHFGEYVGVELKSKAEKLPQDIKWHMLGYFRMNKARLLVQSIPNLWAVESVDTFPKASKLEWGCKSAERQDPLRVFVQVHTGKEKSTVPSVPPILLAAPRFIS